ncbi:MAG: right-handed parallel beta-helix repeat-containing protein [Myxococcota bacterium]
MRYPLLFVACTACGPGAFERLLEPGASSPTVEPLFPSASMLTSYVTRTNPSAPVWEEVGAPCDASRVLSFEACTPSGVLRVVRSSRWTGCAGLEAVDERGWFVWSCVERNDSVEFVSTGFRDGVGLRSVIDGDRSRLRPNRVEILENGTRVLSTEPTVWWNSTVETLNDLDASDSPLELDASNSIYVVPDNQTVSRTLRISSDHVVLVGDIESRSANALPECDDLTCAIALVGAANVWVAVRIRGDLGGQRVKRAIQARRVALVQINDSWIESAEAGVVVQDSRALRITNARVSDMLGDGLLVANSQGILIDRYRADNIGGANPGTAALRLSDGTSNTVVARSISRNTIPYGFLAFEDTESVHLNHVLALRGDYAGFDIRSASGTVVRSAAVGFHSHGVRLSRGKYAVVDLLTTDVDENALSIVNEADVMVSGGVVLGGTVADCNFGGTTDVVGLRVADGVCQSTERVDIELDSSAVSSLVGETVDSVNAAGSMSAVRCGDVNDWLSFESSLRAWSPRLDNPDTGYAPCRDSFFSPCSCTVFDDSLSSNDSLFIPSGTPEGQASCEAWSLNLTASMDTRGMPFVPEAIEVSADGYGDDDTICEANERCLASSRYGPEAATTQVRHTCEVSVGDDVPVVLLLTR